MDFKLNLIEKGDEVKVDGGVEWNGLAILFASYMTFGIEDNDNNDTDDGMYSDEDEGDEETSSKAEQKEYRNQWIIIEPGKYPKDKEVPLDAYTQL